MDNSKREQLAALQELLDEGLLSQQEFEEKKRNIISGNTGSRPSNNGGSRDSEVRGSARPSQQPRMSTNSVLNEVDSLLETFITEMKTTGAPSTPQTGNAPRASTTMPQQQQPQVPLPQCVATLSGPISQFFSKIEQIGQATQIMFSVPQ
jgi:hypothetical protein